MAQPAARRRREPQQATAPLVQRLRALSRATRDRRLAATIRAFDAEPNLTDRLSSALMHNFRDSGHAEAFTILYELNHARMYHVVLRLMAGMRTLADPHDVLQEVFVNIYRYPRKFRWENDCSFRNWAQSIVRNALIKQIRKTSRVETDSERFDLLPSARELEPFQEAAEGEAREAGRRAYVLYLHLYMQAYNELSPKERKALHLVEVDGSAYRAAASVLGIKSENFKMMVFRARRKIFRWIETTLQGFGRG